MKVVENGVVTLYEEDILSLLHNKIHEIPEVEITLVYQETHERPIVKKEVKPYAKGSHHAMVPAEIGKKFSSVILLPAEEKVKHRKKREVIQGKIVILNEEDIYNLLEKRDLQIKDSNIHLIFQEKDERPVRKKEIKKFGERGYHVVVPAEIGKNFSHVILVPYALLGAV